MIYIMGFIKKLVSQLLCHYSESRRKEKLDESIRPQAHSDIVYEKIQTYGLEPDIVIEAKLKEQSIFNYAK